MIRAALRRWLGVPTHAEVRSVTRLEIDADQAWKSGPHEWGMLAEREALGQDRDRAIAAGHRENSGA